LEDSAALLGLVIVFICTLLSYITQYLDAIGSISIGLILIFVSYSLVNELRKLIIGENTREERGRIKNNFKFFP
jgi:divalent metal cation (Fe/Co/Zn/Cd) transporter